MGESIDLGQIFGIGTATVTEFLARQIDPVAWRLRAHLLQEGTPDGVRGARSQADHDLNAPFPVDLPHHSRMPQRGAETARNSLAIPWHTIETPLLGGRWRLEPSPTAVHLT